MEKTFNTLYGEIKVKNVMFDIDGANLEEGLEITGYHIEGILELIGGDNDIENMDNIYIEQLIERNT